MTDFASLGLAKPLLSALAAEGYTKPTPIQSQAIPLVMEGKDLLGIAQTGTGKTAAFALPILHRLAETRRPAPRRGCRCLVLSPTRELATQIADSFKAYGAGLGLTVQVVFGGVKYGPQVRALAGGVDVLVATPGRLIDHINEKVANLSETEVFVLDEADQMLDMGFIVPIRRIAKTLPHKRQNLFFSATMPNEIEKLAGELLHNPSKVSVTPQATTVEKIDQKVLFVEAARKRALLAELFDDVAMKRVLVFTRTKRGADRVAKGLTAIGVEAASIHGDKTQGQRERALAAFKAGEMRALVATDIAARGIDVDGVTHVIQFELPNVPEAYVHRIGRTARAGANGHAVALVADDERNLLRDIQKVTRQTIPSWDRRNDKVLGQAQAALAAVEPAGKPDREGGGGRGRNGQNGRNRKPQALDASGKPQPERGQRARHRPAGYEPLAAVGDAPPKRKKPRNRNRGKGGGQGQGAQA